MKAARHSVGVLLMVAAAAGACAAGRITEAATGGIVPLLHEVARDLSTALATP
jgi:hypothetical protein